MAWFHVIDAQHLLRLLSSSDSSATLRRVDVFRTTYNSSVPALFGDQEFSPTLRLVKGEGFMPIENQSWLPVCAATQLAFSLGLVLLLGSREQAAAALSLGADDPSRQFCNVKSSTDAVAHRVQVASCLYEHFGMQCRNLALAEQVCGATAFPAANSQPNVPLFCLHSTSRACFLQFWRKPFISSLTTKMMWVVWNDVTSRPC